MPIRAIPVEFGDVRPVQDAAEKINAALDKGRYLGHISVTGPTSPSSGEAAHVEGVVLLIDLNAAI